MMEHWDDGREEKKKKRKYGADLSFQSHLCPFLCPQLLILLVNLPFSESPKAHRGIRCCLSAWVPGTTSCALRSTIAIRSSHKREHFLCLSRASSHVDCLQAELLCNIFWHPIWSPRFSQAQAEILLVLLATADIWKQSVFYSSTAIFTFGKINVMIRHWQGDGVDDLIGLFNL